MNIVNKILFKDKKSKKIIIFSVFLNIFLGRVFQLFSKHRIQNCRKSELFCLLGNTKWWEGIGKLYARYMKGICKIYVGYS